MGKNKKKKRINTGDEGGLVYSTNKETMNTIFDQLKELQKESEEETNGGKIILKLRIEKKGRGGKTVTIIEGLKSEAAAEKLAKELKNKLATGGSVKDTEIILQGNVKEKLRTLLTNEGYGVKG